MTSVTRRSGRFGESRDAWDTIEPGVKAQNSRDAMLPHRRDVNRIARGKIRVTENQRFCTLGRGSVDRKDLVDHPEQRVERVLNGVTPTDRDISMHDFLQHL